MRCAWTRSLWRAGLFVFLALDWGWTQTHAAELSGYLLDAGTAAPIIGAEVRLNSPVHSDHYTISDTLGGFHLTGLVSGLWQVQINALGYEVLSREVQVQYDTTVGTWHLKARPLVLDGMVVRARRSAAATHVPVFVENIPIDTQAQGGDLGQVLERAVGINIRRSGGLGSFSTVSIRGSTAEQVQVFLDGIPLNQASGGGVNLGNIALGGIEDIEVYRGAVPARFGGNSIGGVVHLRTRTERGPMHLRVETTVGSFGMRGMGASLGGRYYRWNYLGLIDVNSSANSFRFWDDNGTEYNRVDDVWEQRQNADFKALRGLFKLGRPLASGQLELHNTFDLSHKGIPGISNNQSLHTRFDSWRNLTEVAFNGVLPNSRSSYRLQGYVSTQKDEYKDLHGEVGIDRQHQHTTNLSWGGRSEAHFLLSHGGLLTGFVVARRESFTPLNRLQAQLFAGKSRRHGFVLGSEIEVPLGRLRINVGGQTEWLNDRFFDPLETDDVPVSDIYPRTAKNERLHSFRMGGNFDLGRGWHLQGHHGRYQRAPNFFELFGDRGAIIGNTELTSETGHNWDVGVLFKRPPEQRNGVVLCEMVLYRNRVADLIRFIQNSQHVARPHNIGQAQMWGLEARTQAGFYSVLQLSGNYVYQQAKNQAPFTFEKGNDLPNAPRHRCDVRALWHNAGKSLHYEISRESRHFLDRANLRSIPVRFEHNLGGDMSLIAGWLLSWKVRNLTNNQVADLWGYPLPGRSYFLSLRYEYTYVSN